MAQSTITIKEKAVENIVREMEAVQRSLELFKKKVVKLLSPQYGSDKVLRRK